MESLCGWIIARLFIEMTLYDKVLWEWIKKPWLKYWKMQTLPWRVNLLKRFDKHWDWVHWWVVAALLWKLSAQYGKKVGKIQACFQQVLWNKSFEEWNYHSVEWEEELQRNLLFCNQNKAEALSKNLFLPLFYCILYYFTWNTTT